MGKYWYRKLLVGQSVKSGARCVVSRFVRPDCSPPRERDNMAAVVAPVDDEQSTNGDRRSTDDNPLLQEISAAVDAERDRYNAAYGNHDEFDEQLQSAAVPEAPHNDIATPEAEEDHTVDDGLTIAQRRRPRKAHTTQGHMAAITYLQAWAYSKLCAAKAVVEDDFTLPDTWPSIVSLVTCAAA